MDCYGVIDFDTEKVVLFVPKLDNYFKIWMTVLDLDGYKKKFNLIDEIYFVDEMEKWFADNKPEKVFVNLGVNTDSGLTTMVPEEKWYKDTGAETEKESMHDILAESRVFKNDEEMEIMRWASQITCEAHCNVMRNCKPGQREMQLESFFKYECE